jgi:hypothetical protein
MISKQRLERLEEYKESIRQKGLIPSARYYSIRQYLLILIKDNKLKTDYLQSGRITALSFKAKKLCEQQNYFYLKTNRLKYSHSRSVTCYPIEILEQLLTG